MSTLRTVLVAGALATLVSSPSLALDLSLTGAGEVDRIESTYECADGRTITAHYINADPVYLAIVPAVEGEPLVFVQVMSGSGARYAANEFVWWVKGNDVTLHNIFDGPNAPGLECNGVD